MIPISRDQRLTKEIDGVVYSFLPPVGDLEVKIMRAFGQPVISGLRGNYEDVVKELEKEYKGKRKPPQKEWTKLIEKRMVGKIEGASTVEDSINNINNIIDTALCGWKSENSNVPAFPEKEKPSSMLMVGLKKILYEWYMEHFNLTIDEAKN